ncbi:hypothetical protein EV356DRAFT_499698 [Viridothelium virens]|uniref:assimilatory sulfite reductase (NADPH) n=1 Tax=Viridothelium virens TaxID=1048519 RepID=A0A6A6HNW0_VIRVR|nr:hypothetical protein EV356DRAFT_499698 [Viridothelium virens]
MSYQLLGKHSQAFEKSSSLPFGELPSLSSLNGPTYVTAQLLVQQVAYALSDKIFTYSPETFDLDVALKQWRSQNECNIFGDIAGVSAMQTRAGAGSIALGYMFSKDFDLSKRHVPQSIIASSASLQHLRPQLDQLSLLYSVANPVVAHIAAVDYAAGSSSSLVSDYVSSLALAEDLGMALISSTSPHEIQHMSLLATLLATTMPAMHVYDGVHIGRETTRVVDVLDRSGLSENYNAVLKATSGVEKKHVDNEGKVLRLFQALNEELGTDYKLFEYHGHPEAETVVVVFGSVEAMLATKIVTELAKDGERIGVMNVRVYRPFVEEAFVETLPKTTQAVVVLGQSNQQHDNSDALGHSRLYTDVLAATSFSPDLNNSLSVKDIRYSVEEVWTPAKMLGYLRHASTNIDLHEYVGSHPSLDALNNSTKQYTFWDLDDSIAALAPRSLGQLLSLDSASNVSMRSGYDNLVQGGTTRTDLRSSSRSIEASYSIAAADVTYVGEEKLLGEFDVLSGTKDESTLVLRLPGVKDEDLEKKLPVALRKGVTTKKIQLFILDPLLSNKVSEDRTLELLLTQLAFLKIARPELLEADRKKLAASIGSLPEVLDAGAAEVEKTLRKIELPESWSTLEPEVESFSLPADINVNSFSEFEKNEEEPPSYLKTWETVAKGFVFKEAYGTKNDLRPDLGTKTAIVHVKEHRRLTPMTYDRNIFHIEFDLGDSGLKYDIGEALGIHAENNKHEVEEFVKWYGLNPDEVVEVPSREDPSVLENRTVYQALMQNVDIFGRPPKRFYEALSEFADKDTEKQQLLALGIGANQEAVVEFKRRAEVDTITYADILLEFPSAHPSFHDIVRLVAPMKRREYSIASSQKVQPDSVSLLIVTVGWVDPQGRDRFGQATRYLDALPVGAPVTVSIKPSVMKLPSRTEAPLIMAGLGTGLAPFRAFVQERAWQKQQGMPVGDVLLYMGSRHQREEYLYGEEWEAYQDAGIITLLGRAFSRDQPQKVYIQDRMRQTMDDVRKAYLHEHGSFYLCGPTWPVPDVTNVLEEAIAIDAKASGKRVDSRKEIEKLKDDLRYVLEVY